ncbi:hypothetical protein M3Y94_00629400 [Aphelenchoides besseyi]|nr:hypothetical protein M3Y94_00629400 [Aphelenchoides besseyi]
MEGKEEPIEKLIEAVNGAAQVLFHVHLPIPRITFYEQTSIIGPSKFTLKVAKLVFPHCDSRTRLSLAAINRKFQSNLMTWFDVTKLYITSSPMIVDENTTTVLHSYMATSNAKSLRTFRFSYFPHVTTHFQNLTTLVLDGSSTEPYFASEYRYSYPSDMLFLVSTFKFGNFDFASR